MAKEIPFNKSFASHEKAKYWSDKNELKPNELFKSSSKKIWFKCNICTHEFISSLNDISNSQWCGYCSHTRLCINIECQICFENSFASHDKSKYWSIENKLKPRDVFKNSNIKYLFNCGICLHILKMPLNDINNGYWCIFCANKKLCINIDCKICFEKSFASHEKAKFWSNINIDNPRQIFKSSSKKIWFKCNLCNHDFNAYLYSITKGAWCSYCNGDKLCDINDCIYCFNKSFASHEKSQFWNIKNTVKPREICKNSSSIKYIFTCNICNHEFNNILSDICRGFWCPYCSNPPKQLCNQDECKKCLDKSFASHEKSKHLFDKTINIRQIFKYSNIKYEFKCNICEHIFDSAVNNVTNLNRWCPYCSYPPQKLCDDNDCKNCYNKSFASHEKVKYWSNKNEVNPRNIFKSTHYKYWFKCNKDHEFESQLNNIINGCWCRYCVNKTEQKLYDNLQPIYNNLEQQFKVEWCINITFLPFDFILEEHKIIIELDGIQHFEQVSNWDSPQKTHERDKYKMKQANDNGYSIIRILQEDVFYDTYQWLEELKINIEKIITENKVQNIFMCKNNEYKIFEVLE
jgi:very-short-patch-repair endonuclease